MVGTHAAAGDRAPVTVRRVSRLPRGLTRLARALGATTTTFGDAVLLSRGEGTEVHELDPTSWLVTAPGAPRRRVLPVAGPRARTHLVAHEPSARRANAPVQRALGEWLCTTQVARTLDALGINVLLDVGANKGQFATRMRAAGYTGRIVSFEPLAAFVDVLREASKDDPSWTVVPCALGAEDTETEINVADGPLSSLLPSSDFGKDWNDKLQHTHSETIQVRRLDGVLDDLLADVDDPRVFLKLDTQGFDLQAFRGAGDRIEEILGIQSEVACVPIYDGMPRFVEAVTEYEAAGFELAGMFPVTFHRETLRVIEFDAVLVRPDAVRG